MRHTAERLAQMPLDEASDLVRRWKASDLEEALHSWRFWRLAAQAEPEGEWRIWLVMAGRGFGKTRMGAEWVRERAEADGSLRIALVGATMAEARSVMVEGESGLLACAANGMPVRWEPSLRRLCWENGAVAQIYSAAEPEALRGPQHHLAERAGPKGNYAQRGAGHRRCACPAGRPGRCPCGNPGLARARPVLDRGQWRWRSLDGAGQCNRLLDRRRLALHSVAGRHVRLEPCRCASCPPGGEWMGDRPDRCNGGADRGQSGSWRAPARHRQYRRRRSCRRRSPSRR